MERRIGVIATLVMALAVVVTGWLLSRDGAQDDATGQSNILQLPDHAQAPREDREAKRAAAAMMANATINFFAQVVDEEENPLEGVQVETMISYNRRETLFTNREIEETRVNAVSGADGRFSIEDQRGMSLRVESLKKEGYRFLRGADSGLFTYALGSDIHKPDRQRPVILRMVKDKGPVQVASKEYILRFKWNGGAGQCDLSGDEFGALGVLELNFLRHGWESSGSDFQWKVEATLSSGGLIVIGEKADYLAPTSGYEPTVMFGSGFEDKSVTLSRGEAWLFARNAAGRHFLLHMNVAPDAKTYDRMIGILHVRWNTDGGPLLGRPE